MRIKRASGRAEIISTAFIWSLSLLIFVGLIFLIYQMIGPGFSTINWNFFLEEPSRAGRAGGINSILVSTLLILLICLSVSLPLGLATAIFLNEMISQKKGLMRFVRRSLDILAGVPSIVFGLFGNALFCKYLGLGFSLLSGGLTLACMVLPILVRFIEIGLRTVPEHYRLSGSALALTKKTILFQVILPYAAPGIVVGLILGIGRALAETAALVFTSGYVDRMPTSFFDSGRALSVHIYDLSMNVAGGEANAYKSIFVIMMSLFILNSLAIGLTDLLLTRKVGRL